MSSRFDFLKTPSMFFGDTGMKCFINSRIILRVIETPTIDGYTASDMIRRATLECKRKVAHVRYNAIWWAISSHLRILSNFRHCLHWRVGHHHERFCRRQTSQNTMSVLGSSPSLGFPSGTSPSSRRGHPVANQPQNKWYIKVHLFF